MRLKNDFIEALLKEIEITAKDVNGLLIPGDAGGYLQHEPVETIYFGGGTPSLLSEIEITSILTTLSRFHTITTDAEITLEANPDDISREKLQAWKKAGINRLSIGIQSFFDEDLAWMNRAHSAAQSRTALSLVKEEGFENVTIDLIYGTPGLTDDKWRENVALAVNAGIPHLSCYGLTVEPATALHTLIRQKKSPDVDQEKQANQYLLLMQWLEAAGYEHYEISNFAKPGARSRHNTSYWLGKNYLGLGPSAHSFNGYSRRWNVANNSLYIQAISKNLLPVETEELTKEQQVNEYLMTALRTSEGVNLDLLTIRFGQHIQSAVQSASRKHIATGKMQIKAQHLLLTTEGKLYADGIASDLFV